MARDEKRLMSDAAVCAQIPFHGSRIACDNRREAPRALRRSNHRESGFCFPASGSCRAAAWVVLYKRGRNWRKPWPWQCSACSRRGSDTDQKSRPAPGSCCGGGCAATNALRRAEKALAAWSLLRSHTHTILNGAHIYSQIACLTAAQKLRTERLM